MSVVQDKKDRWPWRLPLVVLLGYAAGYWLLMVRDLPSVGPDWQFEFRSSPRFGPGCPVVAAGGITVTHGRTSILNYLFYPADVVYYAIAD